MKVELLVYSKNNKIKVLTQEQSKEFKANPKKHLY
jgi:hypothetical protein